MCLFAPKKVHKNNWLSKGGGGKIKCRFFVNIKYICEQWDLRNDDKGEAVAKQWRKKQWRTGALFATHRGQIQASARGVLRLRTVLHARNAAKGLSFNATLKPMKLGFTRKYCGLFHVLLSVANLLLNTKATCSNTFVGSTWDCTNANIVNSRVVVLQN